MSSSEDVFLALWQSCRITAGRLAVKTGRNAVKHGSIYDKTLALGVIVK